MTTSSTDLHGVIHGKTIELEVDTGLPDGQQVKVSVQPVSDARSRLPLGEGIRRSAGGWADDPTGLDEFLEWNRQQRKQSRGPIEDLP